MHVGLGVQNENPNVAGSDIREVTGLIEGGAKKHIWVVDVRGKKELTAGLPDGVTSLPGFVSHPDKDTKIGFRFMW